MGYLWTMQHFHFMNAFCFTWEFHFICSIIQSVSNDIAVQPQAIVIVLISERNDWNPLQKPNCQNKLIHQNEFIWFIFNSWWLQKRPIFGAGNRETMKFIENVVWFSSGSVKYCAIKLFWLYVLSKSNIQSTKIVQCVRWEQLLKFVAINFRLWQRLYSYVFGEAHKN